MKYVHDLCGNLVGASDLGIPEIARQPVERSVPPGEIATFSVVVADTRDVTFQWMHDGADIPGATGDSLVVANVAAPEEGPYAVTVKNRAGRVTSTPAALRLSTSPTITPPAAPRLSTFSDAEGLVTVTPMKLEYAPGETVTLTATPFGASVFVGWTGDLSGSANPATLTMTGNRRVRARFASAVPIPPGTIAFWRGEPAAGNVAPDIVGGHDGGFFSGASAADPAYAANGKVGSAFTFDGALHVRVPDDAALRPAQVTAEAWIYPTVSNSDHQSVVGRGSSVNDENAWSISVWNGKPRFWSNHAGQGMQLLEGPSIPLNEWAHLAASFDGKTKRLYVNGSQVAWQSGLGGLIYDPAPIPITIGVDWAFDGPSHPFHGQIDEVSLCDRALAASEVADIYNADRLGREIARPYFTSASPLASMVLGVEGARQLTTSLGTAPVAFALSAGALPPGMALSSAGVVGGAPSAPGTFDFLVRATDAAAAFTEQLCVLRVLQPVAAPPDLVAWWRGEPAAGTVVPDIVGGHDGAFFGGAPATTADGKVGNAFAFDGALHVRISDAAGLRPSEMTAEAWVWPSVESGSHQAVIGCGSSTNDDDAWWMGLLGGRPRFWSKHSGSGMHLLEAPSAIPLNQWTHLAVSFDGATKRLYVNGAQVASQGGLAALVYDPAPVPVTIGADWGRNAAGDFFHGRIDEPSLYRRALSAAEILSIVGAGSAGKAP